MGRITQAAIVLQLAFGTAFTGTTAVAAGPEANDKIRIVDADAKVQSRKRGVCANKLDEADFRALAPGVSWYYNWHYQPNGIAPAGVDMEFVPMAWGDRPKDLEGLEKYLSAGHKPRAVLALNEPNLKGQAFISPQRTAEVYKAIKVIADKHDLPTVGPHMSLGSAPKDSITADDPIENKKVTYTFMVPFLKAFFHYVGDTDVPAVALHSYGNIHEMKWAVGEMHKQFNRPVWMTEYAQWGAKDVNAARTYLIQSTDLLERTGFVAGYAWFKERANDNPKISLLAKGAPGKLSELGQAYVDMPVHDADLYYRLPGNLEAERYVAIDRMDINPTKDADGFCDMTASADGAWIEYNVFVEKAGTFPIEVRTSGANGAIDIERDGQKLATLASTTKDWQTLTGSLALPAGAQKIRLRVAQKGQTLNWIKLSAK